MNTAYDTSTMEYKGHSYTVSLHYDYDMGAPWKEHDGHGEIRESSTPHRHREGSKCAGEWPMNDPDRHCTQFYYDAAATMRKARAEGWGLGPDAMTAIAARLGRAPTRREVIAASVRADFEYCSGWVNDEWHWVWIEVEDDETGESTTLGGLQSDDDTYLEEVARELAEELHRAHAIDNRFADAMACGI